MQPFRRLVTACVVVGGAVLFPGLAPTGRAEAAGPRNPYAGFNLSGINYGAQQWERAQREGRRVWPYYNVPARTRPSGSDAGVGGYVGAGGGGFVWSGTNRRGVPRGMRRARR